MCVRVSECVCKRVNERALLTKFRCQIDYRAAELSLELNKYRDMNEFIKKQILIRHQNEFKFKFKIEIIHNKLINNK